MLRLLRVPWEWWKRTAHKIGNFQARVMLTLFYFVVVGPFALVLRLAADPLSIKPGAARGWRARPIAAIAHREQARKQF